MKHYALCLSNDMGADFSGEDLLPGLVYEVLGVEKMEMLRIVDESGEDYLYPKANFLLLSDADSKVLENSMSAMAA
jgi:hypothetical protein